MMRSRLDFSVVYKMTNSDIAIALCLCSIRW